jgi:hypothetical protein
MSIVPQLCVINKAPNIRIFRSEGGGGFLLAVVEANAKDRRSYGGDIMDQLLAAAGANVCDASINSGQAFATALADQLESNANFRHHVGAVFYATIATDSDSEALSVCTAGDLRVHALSTDEELLWMTRDHNAIDDDAEAIYLNTMPEQREFLRHVPTRAIPATEKKPVECARRPLEGVQSIVICSSVVHRYRDPKEYLASINEAGIPPFGFAAVVYLR